MKMELNIEGRILFDAISQRYRRQINEGMNSNKGIGLDTFILQFNTLTLSMNDDLKKGFHDFSGLMQVLKRQQDFAEEQNNEEMYNSLYWIREYAASWQSAYALRRFDLYMESEAIAKETGIIIDEKMGKNESLFIGFYLTRSELIILVFWKKQTISFLLLRMLKI